MSTTIDRNERYDFTIVTGDTKRITFTHVDENGDGISNDGGVARLRFARVRNSTAAADTLYESSSDDGDGVLTCMGADGRIIMEIPDEDTALFTWAYAYYGLEVESSAGKVTTLCWGRVKTVVGQA